MTSDAVGNIVSEILAAVLAVMTFAFYETEIGSSSSLTGTALIIFAIWDATNDPIAPEKRFQIKDESKRLDL